MIAAAAAVRLTAKPFGPAADAAARGEEREPPQRAAERLPGALDEQEQRPGADRSEQRAPRHGRGAAGATGISSLADGLAGSGAVSRRRSRSGASPRRAASARRMVPNLIAAWNSERRR